MQTSLQVPQGADLLADVLEQQRRLNWMSLLARRWTGNPFRALTVVEVARAARAIARRCSRPRSRGAGRPRGRTVRRASARSGDSGDGSPAGEPPATGTAARA
jgi:hypothetical protein